MEIPQKELLDNYLSSGHNVFANKNSYDPQYKIYLSNYKKFLPEDKNARILDFGCGYGHFLYLLEREKYTNFIGLDISKENITFCKKNISSRALYVDDSYEYLNNLITTQSIEKNNGGLFDFIILNDVLEHISKKETIKLLKMLYKCLNKNGKLIIKVPNHGCPYSIRLRYDDFTHEVGFTQRSLNQVLSMAGFLENTFYPFTYSKYSLKGILGEFVRRFFLCLTKLYMYLIGVSHFNIILHPVLFSVSIKK